MRALKSGTPCQKQQFDHCVITDKWCNIGCKLVLFANRKSHTGSQLPPQSVTLNDLEQHNRDYFVSINPVSCLCWQYETL